VTGREPYRDTARLCLDFPRAEYGFNVEPYWMMGPSSVSPSPAAGRYTDINYALPASRYGQDVASYYVQAWLDRYLKHDRGAEGRLLATRFGYLEPVGQGRWARVTLTRADRLSFYFCSGYAFRSNAGRLLQNLDVGGVGGC
jgi:hypothetical protein